MPAMAEADSRSWSSSARMTIIERGTRRTETGGVCGAESVMVGSFNLTSTIGTQALARHGADRAPTLAERVILEGADHNDAVMFGSRVAVAVSRPARGST
jgi:hypothetical protein